MFKLIIKMRNLKEIDLFLDSSSSSSSNSNDKFVIKKNCSFNKQNEFPPKKQKILEKIPTSDSDSSTYNEKMHFFDMKYEEFAIKKLGNEQENDINIDEKIKKLQNDLSFVKNKKEIPRSKEKISFLKENKADLIEEKSEKIKKKDILFEQLNEMK